MKKLLTILLSITMMLMMFSVAYAEDEGTYYDRNQEVFTVTINDGNHTVEEKHGHDLKIYQVLSGDLFISDTNEHILTNVVWGDGVKSSDLLATLGTNSFLGDAFKNVTSAAEFAETLSSKNSYGQLIANFISENLDSTKGQTLTKNDATGKYTVTGLKPGYYIIEDTHLENNANAPLRLITRVVGNVEITASDKSLSIPTIMKSVTDTNDSVGPQNRYHNLTEFNKDTTNADIYAMGDKMNASADHDINDNMVFCLRATLPGETGEGTVENPYNGYLVNKPYSIIFHDTIVHSGISPLVGKDVADVTTADVADNNAAQTWITDNKDKIRNNLRIFVDSHAEVDTAVEYIAVPKAIYDKLDNTTVDVNKKYAFGGTNTKLESSVTGTTYTKQNCFYYELDKKADGTIEKIRVGINDTQYIAQAENNVRVLYNAKLNSGANIALNSNDNRLYLEYTVNSNDYAKTQEKEAKVWTYRIELSKIDEKANAVNGANFTLEKYIPNGENKTIELTYGSGANSFKRSDFTGDDGETQFLAALKNNSTFSAEGLDDGFYILTETITPNEYNTLKAPIYFAIVSDHSDLDYSNIKELKIVLTDSSFTQLASEAKVEANVVDNGNGTLKLSVINKKGFQLPTTGGIGTTMFYVAGAALVVGAMVALVANKKTEK